MFVKRFNQKLKHQDMFGHVIHLNFKSKGETYPTCIGGMFSIFIQVVMFFYVTWHLKQLIYMESNTLST